MNMGDRTTTEPSDEEILAGVRRRMTETEPMVPLPPAWNWHGIVSRRQERPGSALGWPSAARRSLAAFAALAVVVAVACTSLLMVAGSNRVAGGPSPSADSRQSILANGSPGYGESDSPFADQSGWLPEDPSAPTQPSGTPTKAPTASVTPSPRSTGWVDPSAPPPADRTISGRVTDTGSNPLAGIDIRICTTTYCYYSATDGAGQYSVPVAAAIYRPVYLRDSSGVHASGYSNAGSGFVYNEGAGTSVNVTASSAVVDVTLPIALHATIRVKNTDGAALPGIRLEVNTSAGGPVVLTTDSAGENSAVIIPGFVIVHVDDPSGAYASGYYTPGGLSLTQDSAAVAVGNSDIAINVTMPRATHIRGKVTASPGGGVTLPVYVEVFTPSRLLAGSAMTAADGTYSVAVLPGTYVIMVVTRDSPPGDIWYCGSAPANSCNGGSPVTVPEGGITGLDIAV